MQKRLALSLRHPEVTKNPTKERDYGVHDKVGALSIRVADGLVHFQHDGGRERDGEHDRGVGQATGVGRKVLALDDRQQGHDPDVDEELGAADAGQHQPADQPGFVVRRQQHGDEHVKERGAHARRHEQRPPAVLVHGQRERHARHDYE